MLIRLCQRWRLQNIKFSNLNGCQLSLSALISMGQFKKNQFASCLSNWTVCAIARALEWFCFSLLACKKPRIFCVIIFKRLKISQILLWLISNRTLCLPIRSVIILVIELVGRPRILLIQTELYSTQSYFHCLQLKCCGPACRAWLQASFLVLLLLFSLYKLKSERFSNTCLCRLCVSLDKRGCYLFCVSDFSFKPAPWQPSLLILRRR